MRWLIVILVILFCCFIGVLLLWPREQATGQRPIGYRPDIPAWLQDWMPDPPAAPALSRPPTMLGNGQQWSGKFAAKDGQLGVARFRLISGVPGAILKISASEPGQDDQILCLLGPGAGAARPSGCVDDKTADDGKGGIVVHAGRANITLEAPSGAVTLLSVNE